MFVLFKAIDFSERVSFNEQPKYVTVWQCLMRISPYLISRILILLGLCFVPNIIHFVLHCTILYYTILYCAILYYAILCYTILYYTILYYTMLYYAMLCYTILYYTILYYAILCYAILCYIVLCYAILCYTILYYIFRLLTNLHLKTKKSRKAGNPRKSTISYKIFETNSNFRVK